MSNLRTGRVVAAAGSVLLIAGAIGVGVSQLANGDGGSVYDCAVVEGKVHFFANDTEGDEANEFGPDVDPNLGAPAAKTELLRRAALDPAFMAFLVAYMQRDTVPIESVSSEELSRWTAFYAADREAWCDALEALESRIAHAGDNLEIRHFQDVDNNSAWMYDEPNVDDVPVVVHGQSNVRTFWALVITYPDGTEDIFKLDCGLQPVWFDNPPPTGDTPPPPVVPPPPGTNPPPTNPPVTPPTPTNPPPTNPPGTPPTNPPGTPPPPVTPPPSPSTTVVTPPTTVVKDHTESPVSDDENDEDEVTRPNVPAPTVVIRPTVPAGQTTTTQAPPPPTIPTPPQVTNPLPATPGPAPTVPAPPDPTEVVDDWGEDGIPD